ncbi:MAG: glycosyl transferase [Clostridiales bacterium]|nr:glycosyl transferase [Clostridiales bacterium]
MSFKCKLKRFKLLVNIYSCLKSNFYCMLTIISPVLNTKVRYRHAFHKKLDLTNPQTLNEKVLWLKLKLYMYNPLVIQCADKYRVREYVENCGCGEILNELYSVYDTVDDIDWEELPDQFVLKWNFGAGCNIICTDKTRMNKEQTLNTLRKWGRKKYWLPYSEMQYKYIPKKMVCEKLLGFDISSKTRPDAKDWVASEDYKVYCFNGKPKFIMVCVGRGTDSHPKFYFFNTNWTLARINRDSINAPADFHLEKPECLEKLLDYASRLSAPFPFVRVDFYIVDNKIFFGELTFTPSGGLDTNRLPETDIMMGNLVDISCESLTVMK